MRRSLEEIYCERIRRSGSHATWTPETRLAPGDYGFFTRGVFDRRGSLKDVGFSYRTSVGPPSLTNVLSSGIRYNSASATATITDPMEAVLSGDVRLSYEVGRAGEVLLLTERGQWREVLELDVLLSRLKSSLTTLPISLAVVAGVYETPGFVAGVSSRATALFEIGVNAEGVPAITAMDAGAGGQRKHMHAASRMFSCTSRGRRTSMSCTPLFARVYRIRKKWWGRMGRPELCDTNGNPVSTLIHRTDPADLLYDPTRATMSPEELQSRPDAELFEAVTPELLTIEVIAEPDRALETSAPPMSPSLGGPLHDKGTDGTAQHQRGNGSVDHRRHHRAVIDCPVTVRRRGASSVSGRAHDLGGGGARVVVDRPLSIDEEVEIRLTVGNDKLMASGHVLRDQGVGCYALRFDAEDADTVRLRWST